MALPPLVVPVDELARTLDFEAPVGSAVAQKLEDAIRDATWDVEGYLGWPVTPRVGVQANCYPWPAGWRLEAEMLIGVTGSTPEVDAQGVPTGLFAVTYTWGLDVVSDPELYPIRRYIKAAAENAPAVVQLWQQLVQPRRQVKSVSTEGQSVTYEAVTRGGGGAAGSGAPGALPKLESLARWRKRSVHQSRTTRILL